MDLVILIMTKNKSIFSLYKNTIFCILIGSFEDLSGGGELYLFQGVFA